MKQLKKIAEKIGMCYKTLLNGIKWLKPTSHKKLHLLPGINREVIVHQINKIAESVKKMGIVRPVIAAELDFIDGIKKLYVVDGQHLMHALIRLGYDIPYIVIKIKDKQELVETIALLNSSSKSWCLKDYVTAWSSLNNDYIKLNRYASSYSIEIVMVAAILSGNTLTHGSVTTRIIKNGTFAVKNEARAVKLLDFIIDALNIVGMMNRYENRYFISEYVKYVKEEAGDYNHELFLKKLKKNKQDITHAIQSDGKLVEKFKTMK
jgi:hypothetical protein